MGLGEGCSETCSPQCLQPAPSGMWWTPELGAPHGHQRSRKWLADRDVEKKWQRGNKRDSKGCVSICVNMSLCVCVCEWMCAHRWPSVDCVPSPDRQASVLTWKCWPASICDHFTPEVGFATQLSPQEVMVGDTEPFPLSRISTDWRLRSLVILRHRSQGEQLPFHRQCLLGSDPRPPS